MILDFINTSEMKFFLRRIEHILLWRYIKKEFQECNGLVYKKKGLTEVLKDLLTLA